VSRARFLATVLALAMVTAGGASLPVAADAPPPVTDNGFIPEDRNLSDCIGTLERPGCGSEDKGDLGTYLVFAALILGLGFIGWRITLGVRARDQANDAAGPSRTPPSR